MSKKNKNLKHYVYIASSLDIVTTEDIEKISNMRNKNTIYVRNNRNVQLIYYLRSSEDK